MADDALPAAGFREELHDLLIDRARSLRPLLEANAALHEQRGELAEEVVQALDEAGFFKMSAPRRWGGLCVPSVTMMEVAAELAKGCPSTAWVLSIVTNNVWSSSMLSAPTQALVFRDGVPRICGPQNGAGTLQPKGGGFVLNGSWSYGSASHHSSWALMPAASPEGQRYFVVAPMSDLRIKATWDVAGMKGTGSDTVVAENVTVGPDQVSEITPQGIRGAFDGITREPSDYWVVFPLLRGKAMSVLLGTAEGLLDSLIGRSERPIIYSTYGRRRDSAVWQAGIGEAASAIGVARSVIEKQHRIMDDAARSARTLTYPERATFRGEGSVVASMLIGAVEKLMNLAGSSAYVSSDPAQRYWRDFGMGIRHIVLNIELGYEVYGRQLLGIEPNVVAPEVV